MAKQATSDGCFEVGVLLIDGFALMSYAAVVEPLRAANILDGRQIYRVRNIPARGHQSLSSCGALISADAAVDGSEKFDLLLVVAGGDPTMFADKRVLAWLRRLAGRGVMLGGISGGPVILVRAGLMTGRRFTVHWEHQPGLSDTSSELLLERSLYVIDRDRVTCAGGTAPLDLMHALIAEHHGAALARRVSDWFMHTEVRPAGGPQRSGRVHRYRTTDPSALAALEAMANHLGDPLTLGQLSGIANVSRRQLNRLFREKLGQSTMTYYRELRLEKARELIRTTSMRLTEIALATGFANSAHLSSAHSQKFGQPPSALRK